MHIIGIYRDGGTIFFIDKEDNNKEYCFDKRIGSNTKGQFYLGYPNEDNSNNIEFLPSLLSIILGKISVLSYDKYKDIINLRVDNKLMKANKIHEKIRN